MSQYLASLRGAGDLEQRLKEEGLYSKFGELSDEIVAPTVQKAQITEKYCELCNSMKKERILQKFAERL